MEVCLCETANLMRLCPAADFPLDWSIINFPLIKDPNILATNVILPCVLDK